MEWKEDVLGNVLEVRYGKDHKKLADGQYPVYGSGGLMRYVDSKLYDGPSILIPRKGTLNNIMFVESPFWTVDTMFWSIINTDKVDPKFLFYSICKRDFASMNVGSAVPSMTVNILNDIQISYPKNIEDQRRIVSILSSLDRKIELNNKINADLEEMAQAIFKNWFVDFEPFKDGKFVDSELGMIPEGWKVGTLGDITKNKSAKVKERNDVKVLSPVTTGELVLSEEYFTKQVFSSSIAKYKIVNKGNFAYNPARVNIGSLGRNEFDFDGCVSPVYVVFSVLDGYVFSSRRRHTR